MRFVFPIITAVALAACQPGDAPTLNADGDTCGASGLQNLIGQHRDVLASMTFVEGTRILGPNDVMTMDLNLQRLNIVYGVNNRIEQVYCG